MMTYAYIGSVIFSIATLGGILILKWKSADQPKQVKIVLFGVYFWGFVFLQLLICGIAYALIVPQ